MKLKKILKCIMVSFAFIFLVSFVNANANDFLNIKEFESLNSKNFTSEMKNLGIRNIKKVCSYDFCDNFESESLDKGIKNFVNRYIRTLNEEDVKKSLLVKGIKITKIYYEE